MEINGLGIPALTYLCVNLVAGCAFAWDKRRARRNAWRISESTLLVLAFLGPFGAFAAMCLFRHKTQKVKFWLVPIFAIIHAILIIWLLTGTLR